MTKKQIPKITISRWDGCLLPRDEIRASLLYLAHKTGKTVRFGRYPGEPRYSSRIVNVFICARDNQYGDAGISAVTIRGQDYVFSNVQRSLCLELKGEYILDDNSTTIAVVDRNNIIIRFEITAADNDSARAILAYVVERAIPLLRFDVEEVVESRKDEAEGQYRQFFSAALSERVEAKRNENLQAERDAENHYHSLIAAERLRITT
ncbi:MAG: hypothetical protein GXP38_00420, partial [Chloroflexi bacterium]|nr:hypothetical protein [Chloroflexota bacterium]